MLALFSTSVVEVQFVCDSEEIRALSRGLVSHFVIQGRYSPPVQTEALAEPAHMLITYSTPRFTTVTPLECAYLTVMSMTEDGC